MGESPVIQIRFPPTPSPHYSYVLALAKEAPHYERRDLDGVILHVASYSDAPGEVAQAVDLWSRIYGWTQATLIVRGMPVIHRDRWRILEILGCACTAARSADRRAYCEARADLPWSLPPIPCRLLLMTAGREIEGLPWDRDREAAMRGVWARVLERGLDLCPFFPADEVQRAAGIRATSSLPAGPDIDRLVGEIERDRRLRAGPEE
jgi:hypothetical protein